MSLPPASTAPIFIPFVSKTPQKGVYAHHFQFFSHFFLIPLCSGFCPHLSVDTVFKAPLTSLLLNPSWQCPFPPYNFLLLECNCSVLGLPVSVTVLMIFSGLLSQVLNTIYRTLTTNSYPKQRLLSRLIYLTSHFIVPLGCPTDNLESCPKISSWSTLPLIHSP